MERTLLGDPRDAQLRENLSAIIRSRYLQRVGLYSHKVNSYVPYLAPLLLPELDNRDPMTARQCLISINEMTGLETHSSSHAGFLAPGSINSSIVNLTTATLGVGTLAIPFALYNAGLLLFMSFLIVQAWLSMTSIRQIISALNTTELHSFEEVSCVLFGRKFTALVEVSILLFCFGTAVSYHITIGDLGLAICEKLFDSNNQTWFFTSILLTRTGFLCTVTVLVLLPLCMYDKITELRFTCLIGLGCILMTVVVVVYGLFNDGISPEVTSNLSNFLFPREFHQVMSALGILTFAFCSQPNVPTIFYELEDRSIAKMTSAVSRATGLCMSVYITMGLAGVCRFASRTAPSVIGNLEQEFLAGNTGVVMAYCLLVFAVSMSFPLNVFPIKLTFEQLFIHAGIQNIFVASRLVAVFVVLLSLVCAIAIPNVSTIFDLIGTTVGSLICFVLPAAIYLKILSLSRSLLCRRARKAWIVLITGSILLIAGTATSFAR